MIRPATPEWTAWIDALISETLRDNPIAVPEGRALVADPQAAILRTADERHVIWQLLLADRRRRAPAQTAGGAA